jgi:hypothetical protein
MQIFVPYRYHEQTAVCLDRQRLGKQRVETLQVLRANLGLTDGWVNHPASRMWKGHEVALARYGMIICREWKKRGYKDTVEEKILALVPEAGDWRTMFYEPSWMGDPSVHLSHQSNLLRKDPDHYGQWFADSVPNDLPYVWRKP